MKTVGIFEAKTHLSTLLKRVEQGEEIIVTRHGKPVARLVPVGAVNREGREDIVARLKSFRKGRPVGGLSRKALIEEGRR
jgi:prevent-host-death family protein